jgi:hypothetical protein
VETFTRSGALSISTVPRAATALIVVFHPRGPRRACIDYVRPNPHLPGVSLGRALGLAPPQSSGPPRGPTLMPRDPSGGIPLTNILHAPFGQVASAALYGLCLPIGNAKPATSGVIGAIWRSEILAKLNANS